MYVYMFRRRIELLVLPYIGRLPGGGGGGGLSSLGKVRCGSCLGLFSQQFLRTPPGHVCCCCSMIRGVLPASKNSAKNPVTYYMYTACLQITGVGHLTLSPKLYLE